MAATKEAPAFEPLTPEQEAENEGQRRQGPGRRDHHGNHRTHHKEVAANGRYERSSRLRTAYAGTGSGERRAAPPRTRPPRSSRKPSNAPQGGSRKWPLRKKLPPSNRLRRNRKRRTKGSAAKDQAAAIITETIERTTRR